MPTMSREPLFLQELNGGDNNRTSATFQAPDTYRFVGEITDFVPDWDSLSVNISCQAEGVPCLESQFVPQSKGRAFHRKF